MSDAEIQTSHQLVVIARLSEFCQWRIGHRALDREPWLYMRDKLLQIEEPLAALKKDLFQRTGARLLEEMRAGPLDNERFADYRLLFEKLLSRGDFADIAFHLGSPPPPRPEVVAQVLAAMKPHSLFDEERKSPAERNPAWEKLVGELYGRLRLDLLGKILARKPITAKRRAFVLRRQRANVAEYCTVVHVPLTAADTFTPFMLPRIEAIIAANLRFLNHYR